MNARISICVNKLLCLSVVLCKYTGFFVGNVLLVCGRGFFSEGFGVQGGFLMFFHGRLVRDAAVGLADVGFARTNIDKSVSFLAFLRF